MTGPRDGQEVVVVTGGGAGIGAAVAEELGRQGRFVVTIDPLVTLDGAEQLPAPEETTAGRIVAAGGSAQASPVSVTDAAGVQRVFDELERVDAVVNVAGISRPTSFTGGTDDDWRGVLEVHLDGYRNVLATALPRMAAAGHGRIVGVTSGSGWRQADAGAYACAKRAVAALTWQLGRSAPAGVTVNAMSPIAVTRMVTAALGRAAAQTPATAAPATSAATGGLSLGSMPQPEDIGPFGAYLASDAFSWCSGEVLFAGGSEVALVESPRFLEVVRTDGAVSLAHLVEAVAVEAFAPAEAGQASGGGSNPRFGDAFGEPTDTLQFAAATTCAVASDRPELAAAVTAALEARGVSCTSVDARAVATGFDGPAAALAAAAEQAGQLDAVVVALAGRPASTAAEAWQRILDEHTTMVDDIHTDAAWSRAVADHSAQSDSPVRLVTLVDAGTSGGRSRAQAATQLSRSARRATGDRVLSWAISVEADGAGDAGRGVAELTAHLVAHPEAHALSGAELAAGPGWLGLRSHPRPTGSVTLGGPVVPDWLDGALRSIVGARPEEA